MKRHILLNQKILLKTGLLNKTVVNELVNYYNHIQYQKT